MAQKRKKSARRAVARKKATGVAAARMGFVIDNPAIKPIMRRKRVQVKEKKLRRLTMQLIIMPMR